MIEEKMQELTKPLEKTDIEFRVGMCTAKGFSLLAYKTARVDKKRLNEVFGLGWTNKYFYDSKGFLCCKIGVYDSKVGDFVYREDVGTESNTEKEKGSYSDAFKRAAFNFGIGDELYNTGLIWINGNVQETGAKNKYNKPIYRPTLFTNSIMIDDMQVINNKPHFKLSYNGQVIFNNLEKEPPAPTADEPQHQQQDINSLKRQFEGVCKKNNTNGKYFLGFLGIDLDNGDEVEEAVRYYLKDTTAFYKKLGEMQNE